jgi:DNA-binding transcriptional LysR family regulator
MELRHLRTVVAIARHGSFTKAGEELHLAQSAVSQQLSRLEAELGIALFTRSSRRVELTADGALVLDYAERVLSEVEGLRDELDERAGLLRGDLRLGGMWPTGLYDLYAVIADFHKQHPGVAIHFVEGTQEELLAQIRADELDAIFTAVDPDALGDEFAATLLSEEEFVCTLPIGHPLSAQDQVTFSQLAGMDLVTYRENSALRRRLEQTLDDHGLTPRNAFICTEMGAVRALVSKGMGVAVIPRSAAEEPGPPIELRPIGPAPFTWPVALVWRARRRQPPAAKAFLALAIAWADEAPAVRLVA